MNRWKGILTILALSLAMLPESFGFATTTGEKILPFPPTLCSMELHDTDVKAILRAFAKEHGLNIIVGEKVEGRVTVSFKDISLNDAFLAIVQNGGLTYTYERNVIEVNTLKEKNAILDERGKNRENEEKATPLVTKAIRLKHPINPRGTISGELPKETEKIKDLEELAEALKKKLSERKGANIAVINRTNTLIVTDIVSSLEKMETLIKELDQPLSQVTIEAKIVEVSTSAAKELGVAWGGRYRSSRFEASGAAGLKTLESTRTRGYGPEGTTDELEVEIMPQTGNVGLSGENLTVNLPAAVGAGTGGAIGFMIGKIGRNVLDIQLSALESKGEVEVLSTPRVITLDNQRAYIKSGYEVPYREYEETATGRGEYTVEFKTAAIELEVTPHIMDEEIFLDVVVGKGEPDWSKAISGNPPLITRSLTTKVRVKSGETIVIGGLMKEYNTGGKEAVPWLHRIPVLGWLFKKKTSSMDKSELLIFITPTIFGET